ncbi:hypothetical protein SDC9_60105 [bioreactor metagenome]|uniref:Uncharacterized protein n=1 Tax=bioreactor metagenome TaxID=1076179 RepID=A0A644XBZ7_9ZZZZ
MSKSQITSFVWKSLSLGIMTVAPAFSNIGTKKGRTYDWV